jgi:hypothetical protein
MARIQVYVRRELRIDRLNVGQTEMLELGNEALDSVKRRLRSGLDPNDSPAPPLNPWYARLKERILRKPARRDAQFGFERSATGRFVPVPVERQFLPNLRVRTVSENYAEASNSTEGNVKRYRRVQASGKGKPNFVLQLGGRTKAAELDRQTRRRTGLSVLAYSPSNTRDVLQVARFILKRAAGRMVSVRGV